MAKPRRERKRDEEKPAPAQPAKSGQERGPMISLQRGAEEVELSE
jgi:hypothetical protein